LTSRQFQSRLAESTGFDLTQRVYCAYANIQSVAFPQPDPAAVAVFPGPFCLRAIGGNANAFQRDYAAAHSNPYTCQQRNAPPQ
jgi:hypothetical protein